MTSWHRDWYSLWRGSSGAVGMVTASPSSPGTIASRSISLRPGGASGIGYWSDERAGDAGWLERVHDEQSRVTITGVEKAVVVRYAPSTC